MKTVSSRPSCCLVLIVTLILTAYSQSPKQLYLDGKNNWRNAEYAQAYSDLKDYRATPWGRTLEVDYMLATSACRYPGNSEVKAWGGRHLKHIMNSYSLTPAELTILNDEVQKCTQLLIYRSPHDYPPQGTPGFGHIPASLHGSAKTYYWVGGELPLMNYPASRVKEKDPGEFERRLISRNGTQDAELAVKSILERNCQGDSRHYGKPRFTYKTQHFVLVSFSNKHKIEDLQLIGQTIEPYYSFLRKAFDIPEMDHYLVIYLVPSIPDLQSLAMALHGLKVSGLTIGYSFQDDLSTIGVIPGTVIGTLRHELFHLLARSNFGDIPQWLDEGIASLYEESDQKGDAFVGRPGWRGHVLRILWDFRPTLSELITSIRNFQDIPSLDGREGIQLAENLNAISTKKQAAYLAYARYFMLYLQNEKDAVQTVYRAFRNHMFADSGLPHGDQALNLIKTVLEERDIDKANTICTNWIYSRIQK